MKILVAYDSVFNNTKKLAELLGVFLSNENEVSVKRVSEVDKGDMNNLDFLFIGSPTRAFQPTKQTKNFIKQMDQTALKHMTVAVFDTRMVIDDNSPKVLKYLVRKKGYANDTMANLFEKKGGKVVSDWGSFFVDDSEGPLSAGEDTHITDWASNILDDYKK